MIQEQFAKAWGTIENPPLDSVNPHFKNRFASLSAIYKVIRKACIPNGITYHQAIVSDDVSSYMVTWVQNLKGERLELSHGRIPEIDNPQPFGSDLTYRKRYYAQLDWGIIGEEEDDGEIAEKTSAQQKLEVAKKHLWNAIKAYSEKYECDPNALANKLSQRPDYDGSFECINKLIAEFENV